MSRTRPPGGEARVTPSSLFPPHPTRRGACGRPASSVSTPSAACRPVTPSAPPLRVSPLLPLRHCTGGYSLSDPTARGQEATVQPQGPVHKNACVRNERQVEKQARGRKSSVASSRVLLKWDASPSFQKRRLSCQQCQAPRLMGWRSDLII